MYDALSDIDMCAGFDSQSIFSHQKEKRPRGYMEYFVLVEGDVRRCSHSRCNRQLHDGERGRIAANKHIRVDTGKARLADRGEHATDRWARFDNGGDGKSPCFAAPG